MGSEEKRAHARINYQVPIEISFVNKGEKLSAQSLNHCEDGICLESRFPFHPGETLNIRVKDFHPHGPCTGLCEGLRSITLAEVKWCHEVLDTESVKYMLGIHFYAPVY